MNFYNILILQFAAAVSVVEAFFFFFFLQDNELWHWIYFSSSTSSSDAGRRVSLQKLQTAPHSVQTFTFICSSTRHNLRYTIPLKVVYWQLWKVSHDILLHKSSFFNFLRSHSHFTLLSFQRWLISYKISKQHYSTNAKVGLSNIFPNTFTLVWMKIKHGHSYSTLPGHGIFTSSGYDGKTFCFYQCLRPRCKGKEELGQ